MKHVFVETNWVVSYAAPPHQRSPTAVGLARRAAAGELQLYVPSVCLSEARYPIRTKFYPRPAADAIRNYLEWTISQRSVRPDEAETVRRVLDQYEASVLAELNRVDERLHSLRSHPGIEVFALNDGMLTRAVELSARDLNLKPFDQAILAAVLVRAEELRAQGATDVSLCELDGDLQPWDKYGRSKQPLTGLYDSAKVWVYGDFAMEAPGHRVALPEE